VVLCGLLPWALTRAGTAWQCPAAGWQGLLGRTGQHTGRGCRGIQGLYWLRRMLAQGVRAGQAEAALSCGLGRGTLGCGLAEAALSCGLAKGALRCGRVQSMGWRIPFSCRVGSVGWRIPFSRRDLSVGWRTSLCHRVRSVECRCPPKPQGPAVLVAAAPSSTQLEKRGAQHGTSSLYWPHNDGNTPKGCGVSQAAPKHPRSPARVSGHNPRVGSALGCTTGSPGSSAKVKQEGARVA